MYAMRLWATRHARGMEATYRAADAVVRAFDPVWRLIGYRRLERPAARLERAVKGPLFDCRMCGHCVLFDTGMSCPINCPKSMRNGPCGGVRPDGRCEVEPAMRCVWVEAWSGSRRMRHGVARMQRLQGPLDHRDAGTSAWLRLLRQTRASAPDRTSAPLARVRS